MQIGVITVDGRRIGVVTMSFGDAADKFALDYNPSGRAELTMPEDL